MAKVLVAYATRAGETKKIAELIAEGLRFGLAEVELKDAAEIKSPEALGGYDGYVFGSATYHGEMLPSMKQLLFLGEKADLAGKVGASFGAYGWSGEAPERIFETMRHIFKMDMVGDSLRLKAASLDGAVPMAQGYGKQVGAKLA
ncbi:flavodoxin/nitric oxide synthase [Desulfarculus baarsii DSM 2075]|uniref:Flavodoxin/nitric oxide synthase n=1 Tax=Desulfarculus baarsii (strain ATCC 33931 / DSM 2075 / LMG 7858 / VKM B-1802 / 2st14) TaxID=644282 RepID=E1QHF9_DESB2|nr:flavodoxin domain-containing protein [Desulfarculus baarsii]ADK85002.1 flavodoxin/nitric oxide synthase [Desulfarculus baarsii DSM 2075]